MPPTDSAEPGDPAALGPYRVTGRLGEGGQGVVFRGEGPSGEQVAIKLLHARLAADSRARSRFVREVEAAERVASFCTAKVLHADVAGDRPYIVSEFVAGVSLYELVTRQGPRTEGALERLAIGTATALVAIHQAGLIHRDLKPQNVLLGPDGPRVIDFGIAKALDSVGSQTSQVIGTPAYMAPEQIRGETLTPAADVFAWACTMAFAGTGKAPFGHDAMPAVINRILHEEPRLTGLPPRLESLLRACLDKDPAGRPTARRLLAALLGEDDDEGTGDLLTQETGPVPAAPPVPSAPPVFSAPSAPGEPRRPAGAMVWAVPVILLVVIAALGGALAMSVLDGDDNGHAGTTTGRPLAGDRTTSPPSPSETASPSPSPSSSRQPRTSPPDEGFPAGYAGTWVGVITQSDGRTWSIRLTLRAGETVGRVHYPSPGCSGTLTLLGRSGDTLSLREDILQGRNACTDHGAVTLRLRPNDAIAFAYSAVRDVGTGSYTANGVLRRS
ncbi:hypothetical protein Acsp03_37270 [Actinomadura sp. NBRC 104412]|uniref:serine/threonine-protein kinase n=1 Tax=Actinomadura sp. NBRC 104412 TaxID=3032203 RepID=UPI0024A3E7F2|nr:serine/threonine-protein kinase [Actinomadura sp. NBRC 104412]GLZ06261.1 hypothetical protein Acsp03_37270 [Actinomadura sp. NBRC 104412]